MKKREEGKNDNTLPDQEVFTKLPWYRPTSRAAPKQDPALELFIKACITDFLDTNKKTRIKDNLTQGQRDALQSLCNFPVSHGAACQCTDKSGVTVITDLESDNMKIMQKLWDRHYYDIQPPATIKSVINRVKAWSKKWNEKGNNDVDTRVYIEDSHTGKCKPLVKTHKSACSAACGLVVLYPNVNNNMGLPAVTSPLKEHPSCLGICTDCIMEALDKALRNNVCLHRWNNLYLCLT